MHKHYYPHGDDDHIKESIYIINNFSVDTIYINDNELSKLEKEIIELASKKNIRVIKIKEMDSINIGNNKLVNLNKSRDNENDSSLVIYTNINNYQILTTGDISKKVEIDLLDKYKLNNLDILKLSHHGSKTSSDYKFLATTNPRIAIISSGLNNRFNHPSVETIINLNNLNIYYLNTSKNGSIKFNLDNGTLITYPP